MVCKFNRYVLWLSIILIEKSESKLNLEWNDEFNSSALDTDKWEIENESGSCHGQYSFRNKIRFFYYLKK